MGQSCCTSNNPNTILPTNESIPNERNFTSESSQIRKFDSHTKQGGYLYNYSNSPSFNLNQEFEITKTHMEFPQLSVGMEKIMKHFEPDLKNIKSEIDTNTTFLVENKSEKFLLQTSKNWSKGTGYCRLGSFKGEHFEGLIRKFMLVKGVIILYTGEAGYSSFLNNRFNGFTRYICPNGDQFEGFMRNGKKEGKGVVEWEDGSRFEGGFVKDRKEGYGEYIYIDGDRYLGNFKNDLRNGYGKLF